MVGVVLGPAPACAACIYWVGYKVPAANDGHHGRLMLVLAAGCCSYALLALRISSLGAL